jgi:hypothetical protein
LELKYLRMDTYMPLYGPLDAKLNEGADKGSVSYILFGGNSYFGDNSKSKAMSYTGAALGIGIVDMKDGGSATKFACDAKLGGTIKNSFISIIQISCLYPKCYCCYWLGFLLYRRGGIISVPDYASIFQSV